MENQYCVPSAVYLIFIDLTDYKRSHLLKVESVKSTDGIETYLIPRDYAHCKVASTEEEGMHTIKLHFNDMYDSCKSGIYSELTVLTNEYDACVSHDVFTQKRKSLLRKKIQLLNKTETSLIQMCTHTYSVETFSGRYATGHSLDDIEPN